MNNWRDYLLSNPDLLKVYGSEKEAFAHYENHGVTEYRPSQCTTILRTVTEIPQFSDNRRRLVVGLNNPGHFGGLFNQLIALYGSLVIGHVTNADVIVRGFYPEFKKHTIVPLSGIIDFALTNRLLDVLGMRSKLLEYKGEKYSSIDDSDKRTLSSLLTKIKQGDSCLDLGAMFCSAIYNNEHSQFDQISNFLRTRVFFHSQILEIEDKMSRDLKISNYLAVHYRLEDDTKVFAARQGSPHNVWLENEFQKYTAAIKGSSAPLFVASGLTPQSPFIKRLGPCRMKPTVGYGNLPRGVEVDAIFDYLLCLRASKFIGHRNSTFSHNVDLVFKSQNKQSQLV